MLITRTTYDKVMEDLEEVYDHLDSIHSTLQCNGYDQLSKQVLNMVFKIMMFQESLEREPDELDELDVVDRKNDERKLEELEKCK